MNRESNEQLAALHRYWKWQADWMTCRSCNRNLIASRDGEPIVHGANCKYSNQQHPWRALRDILNTVGEVGIAPDVGPGGGAIASCGGETHAPELSDETSAPRQQVVLCAHGVLIAKGYVCLRCFREPESEGEHHG